MQFFLSNVQILSTSSIRTYTYANAYTRRGVYVKVKLKAFNEIDDDDAMLFFQSTYFLRTPHFMLRTIRGTCRQRVTG